MKGSAIIAGLFLAATTGHAAPWTLAQALQYARTNAPDTRMARQRVAASEALVEQANSAFWPGLRVQSSYTRTDHPGTVFGMALNQRSYSPALDFNHVPEADDLNVRGILSIPLYAGGRNRAGREAAQAGARAADAEAKATQNSLEYEIARTYYTLLKTRRFIEAAEATVHSLEGNLSVAEKRLNAGTLLKSELLDIEVRLGQSREDLIRARHAATLATLSFRNLLGLSDPAMEVIEGPRVEVRNPGVEMPVRRAEDATRPEVQALAARERAAEADLRRAKGGYLPRVDAFGQVEHDYGWQFDGNGRSYAAGVVAQWDLWDGHRTRGRVNEARANLELIREEQAKLGLAIELEAAQATLRLTEAEERLRVASQTLVHAQEAARLIQTRFEQGLTLATQLIDAEAALIGARVRVAEAEGDRLIAIAALRKAYGWPQAEGETHER